MDEFPHLLTTKKSVYQFHDMVYYMVITITTVGYGDIYPHTTLGQMMVIGMFVVILGLIPKQWKEFTKVRNMTSIYSRRSYNAKGKGDSKHILILGNAPPDAVKTFLTECYHSDHGVTETNVVIMKNHAPSDDMLNILKLPNFHQKVFYLQGNPMNS